MRKFIYPFAMMAGLIIASSCTENEGVRMRELRTRSISTAASASDNTGNPDATPDANRPSPDTRMAYEDNNEAGMVLSWQPTDAFKGFYTTPHVQEVNLFDTQVPFTLVFQYYRDIKKMYGEAVEINWSSDTEKNNGYFDAYVNGRDKTALEAMNVFLTTEKGGWVAFNFEKENTMMVVQCYKSNDKWVVKRAYREKE